MDKNLESFIEYLLKWNKTHKLTNYKTKDEILRQIEDSLYPLDKIKNAKTAIDVGTGAGFPGLILAMKMPNTKWYLVEPLKKRYSFLNYVKLALNLDNVTVIPQRLENSNAPKADLVTSRAVMPTKEILKIIKPFLKENATILLYKGSDVQKELEGLKAEITKKNHRNYVFIKDFHG
jgi:16S rRNA (guanine527-N7)-methyltransferase